MLTNAQWMRLEPLNEACRPKGKTPPQDLRRTMPALVWQNQNGAKWRAIPADLGPWWRAAQTFIRCALRCVRAAAAPCWTCFTSKALWAEAAQIARVITDKG